MKYKTFRNLILAGGATAVLGGGGALLYTSTDGDAKQPAAVTQAAPQTMPQAPVNASRSADAPTTGAGRMEQLILETLSRPATTDKIKDAFHRESFKVNFFRDSGAQWTRLKIDLDRDEKWDEKWDLENGQPHKRFIATRDDENYDQEYRWRNGRWEVKKK